MSKRSTTRDHRDEPTYWFALMEIAREKGDFEGAAAAKRELERLGVRVSYQRPRREVVRG
ncbi:MAG: hypothetical protein AB7K24_01825 [Gemmataceae bacterium]